MKPLKKTAKDQKNSIVSVSSSAGKKLSTTFKISLPDKTIDLIKTSNIEALTQLINDSIADLSFLNQPHSKSGKYPLGVAAEEGRQMESELLIKSKVEIDKKDSSEMTASLYAAKNGEREILTMLLDAGADLQIIHRPTEETLLSFAAKYKYVDVVAMLIDRGLSVEHTNIRHETPLWNALKIEYYPLCDLLLKHGANINVERPGGDTALLSACFTGKQALIEYIILHGGDVTHSNQAGETALMIAARHNHVLAVQYLLNQGAMINAMDQGGKTALMYAVINGKREAVAVLLERGAYVNLSDIHQYSALIFAARGYRSHFPPHNTSSSSTGTAGSISASESSIKVDLSILELLCQHPETAINAMDKSYYTALMHACEKNLVNEAANCLLTHGADPTLRNIDGLTAEMLIKDENKRKQFQELVLQVQNNVEIIIRKGGIQKLPEWVDSLKRK
jgi:ankyrin repeat protein